MSSEYTVHCTLYRPYNCFFAVNVTVHRSDVFFAPYGRMISHCSTFNNVAKVAILKKNLILYTAILTIYANIIKKMNVSVKFRI